MAGLFKRLDNSVDIAELLQSDECKYFKSIVLWRPVQSGKTSDVLKIAQAYYKTSALIFISDKNTSLAGQTNERAKVLGFEIINYRDGMNLGQILRSMIGKKKIIHLLMEVNNLSGLKKLLYFQEDLNVTIIIDEADKSRNTIEANEKKNKKEKEQSVFDIEEDEVADGSDMPPVTKLLFIIKNMTKIRDNSRTIFVSATPAAVLTAEKDDWLVLYKAPYNNYEGNTLDNSASFRIYGCIKEMNCKARDRWTGSMEDQIGNSFYDGISFGTEQFAKAPNRCEDLEVTQLCLISLENRKIQQAAVADEVIRRLRGLNATSEVSVVVFNSDTKESSEQTLADIIRAEKEKGFKKIVFIAGFMASRGVSFTDFTDKTNAFELIIQIHYTKKNFPLNSSQQNMRLSGPPRRTIKGHPVMICNYWCQQDLEVNFNESFRIIKELAEREYAELGRYNPARPLTQPYIFRYLKQGYWPERFIYPSSNPADHLPIEP